MCYRLSVILIHQWNLNQCFETNSSRRFMFGTRVCALEPSTSFPCYLSACGEAWKRLGKGSIPRICFTSSSHTSLNYSSQRVALSATSNTADRGWSLFQMSQSKRSPESKQHQPELTNRRYGRGIQPNRNVFLMCQNEISEVPSAHRRVFLIIDC